MPRGNGTGPMGWGPMTGRAAGYCAGYPIPGYMNAVPGRGAWGRGGGRGWRHWYHATGLPGWLRFGGAGWAPFAPPAPETEKQFLQEQADFMQSQLDGLRRRLDELSGQERPAGEEEQKE